MKLVSIESAPYVYPLGKFGSHSHLICEDFVVTYSEFFWNFGIPVNLASVWGKICHKVVEVFN